MRQFVLIVALLLSACSTPVANVNEQSASDGRPALGLDRVPPADPAAIRRAEGPGGWKNPFIVVRPEGVELVRGQGSSGADAVSVDRMREVLRSLPAEAWPLGRVVAVQELGIRSGNDDARIEANRKELEQMLTSLQITIDWWPTA